MRWNDGAKIIDPNNKPKRGIDRLYNLEKLEGLAWIRVNKRNFPAG